jgi:mono/diheme cytochrome c family protein
MFWIVLLFAQAAAAPQVERGQALFLDPAKGCVNCHALKGKGTAVGPNLTGIGRLSPAAIATAVHSTVTQYVQKVKLSSGETFAAMPAKADEKTAFFDLSKTPPELRTFDKAAIKDVSANDNWKHPPAAAKISGETLADIVAYIRYASTGARTPVDPGDVQ